MSLSAALRPLVDLVLPPRCPGCGVLVEEDLKFCGECWNALRFISDPSCSSCGKPFSEGRDEGMICAECLADPPLHDGIRAAVLYDDLSRSIVLRLKHGGKIGLARLIARHLQRHLPSSSNDLVLIPVPLHRWRLWKRGFNQSILIARALAGERRLPVETDILRRIRPTPPLKGMTRKQRGLAVRGVFDIPKDRRERIRGKHVLLVDDVYTTGATSKACVRLLRQAGAAKVTIFCWARVLREGDEGSGM
ncbi:ComF family protein [Blastomonas natatoria]|uniref:ComF family protein n=1 Tax=Blastomonas natatoria TaxID=34015 RepID=A0A2V3UPR7_9SPHN|nr:ComF family protein [Blastomonas natatoria]PXW68166.1 ComF family protein [Blastomonas natatoria]